MSKAMVEMGERKIDTISIIPLSLGSILMLASGAGLVTSRYFILAGLLCFVVFGLVEIISKKVRNKK